MGLDSITLSEVIQAYNDKYYKLSLLYRHQFMLFASMYICGEERRPSEEKGGGGGGGGKNKIHETWKQKGDRGHGEWEGTKLGQMKKKKEATKTILGGLGTELGAWNMLSKSFTILLLPSSCQLF